MCRPETHSVVWPCDEKRIQECCKASNNDEGGREDTSRKPILRWMNRVRSDLKQHQLDPKLTQNEKDGERQSWRSTPDRDKIGKGEKT